MDYLHDLNAFLPGIIAGFAGLAVLLIDTYKDDHAGIFGLTVVSLAAGLVLSVIDMFGPVGEAFSGMITYGGVSAFVSTVVLFGSLFCVLIIRADLLSIEYDFVQQYSMLLFATIGML